ncbi:hypothetical protein [Streptomyces lavendulae]|uniref:hypothetical protein n=1 Tax=Streptomyces lavendulae TaxID=1914 RepID=UPI0004BEC4AD|nr:hypothetical protein [Streptomyces lavendulae]
MTGHISPQEATLPFPPAEIAKFRTITSDTLAKVDSGDQRAATSRVTDLETAWDDDQSTLEPKSEKAWSFLDGEIDRVLKAVRAPHPDKPTEVDALDALLTPSAEQPGDDGRPGASPCVGAVGCRAVPGA